MADREPNTREGVVAEHVACGACGYDLYGARSGRCPECGVAGQYRWPGDNRPLSPRWRRIALALALPAPVIWLCFYSLLWSQGLAMMDLWGSGIVRAAKPAAMPFIGVAGALYYPMLSLAPVALVFSLFVGVFAVARRDARSCVLLATAAGLAIVSGCVTCCSGLVLAGV